MEIDEIIKKKQIKLIEDLKKPNNYGVAWKTENGYVILYKKSLKKR